MAKKKEEEKKQEAQVPATTGETAVVSETPKTINELFSSDYVKMAIQKAAPKHLDAERFLRIANTALTRTPKLMGCTVSSFWNCLIELSAVGLEPDGRNAHLIPYKDKCTLVIDYKGIVDVVRRSGEVSTIHADVVCENDDFEYNRGIVSKHIINLREPRGDMYAAYSQVIFKDRSESYEVMSLDEINKIRNSSPAYSWAEKGDKSKGGGKKDSTWHKHPEEMSKKTVFRRHSKWLPFSAEIRKVIEADDKHLFPDIAGRTISESDIRNMDDGTRMSIKKQPAEPEKQTSGVIDAETTDGNKYPSREVMIESFATMGEVQHASVFDEAGVQIPDETHPMADEDIRKVYDVIQAQKGAK